jgi:hypothetical protein
VDDLLTAAGSVGTLSQSHQHKPNKKSTTVRAATGMAGGSPTRGGRSRPRSRGGAGGGGGGGDVSFDAEQPFGPQVTVIKRRGVRTHAKTAAA